MSPKDICIIMNAGSGQQDAGLGPEKIEAAFVDLGAACTVKLIDDGATIEAETRNALNEGYKKIVAAGGDGTICAVASAIRGSAAAMGILPLGTFNYVARSLDVPTDVAAAAKVIVQAKSRTMRIATLNDSVFLNNASLGAYPAILETREGIYKRWGRSRPAAYWAVIKTLGTVRPPLRLRITADGKTRDVRSPLVFVVNNAYQLRQMGVEGADLIEDGKMVVFIAPDATRIEMIRMAAVIAMGMGLPERKFEVMSGAEILIEGIGRRSRRSRAIARDGEREHLSLPFRLKVIEDALTVLVADPDPGTPR
ncbi:MAG: diacylglycerol kinase family protein [bacterium]